MLNLLKILTLADFIIILMSLAALIWSYDYYWATDAQGKYAIVSTPNQPDRKISLEREQHFQVQGKVGTSVLEVHAEKIRFVTSPCHNKYCIHSGWQKRAGDFVACLPNQVSIEIFGQQEEKFDSIAY